MKAIQILQSDNDKESMEFHQNFFIDHIYKEKIRSGQPFLYREGGMSSMVIDIRLKEHISGVSLHRAFHQALLRYPYFACKITQKNGDFYLTENPLPFNIEETAQLRPLGGSQVNYHLIDVTYFKNIIYVSFHHGICDGRGILPFVRTLMYYYCTEKYGRQLNVQGVRLAEEPLLAGETKEPFQFENRKAGGVKLPEIHKAGFSLPDSLNSVGNNKYYRCEIKIDSKNFVDFTKENDATPAVAAALLFAKAIKSVYPDAKQPVMCNLASDLRKGINLENTFKNCVGTVSFPYTSDLEELPLKKQAADFRKKIAEHKKTENLRAEIIKNAFLCDKLDELSSYKEKKDWMAFFDDLITDTFLLSYVGQCDLGDCDTYIESMHMYGSGTTGLTIQMMSAGNYITLNMMQSFDTYKYAKAFAEVMKETGVDFSMSDLFEFATPKDSINQ
jgi:hypothetical protein